MSLNHEAGPVSAYLAREAEAVADDFKRLVEEPPQPESVGMTHIPFGPTDVLVRAIVASQAILAQHFEPDGMSRDQAFALLLGILDHEEVLQAIADVVRSPSTAA